MKGTVPLHCTAFAIVFAVLSLSSAVASADDDYASIRQWLATMNTTSTPRATSAVVPPLDDAFRRDQITRYSPPTPVSFPSFPREASLRYQSPSVSAFKYCPPTPVSFPSLPRIDPSGFDVSGYVREQSLAVPDPERIWLQDKLLDDVQNAMGVSMSIGAFGGAPSVLSGLNMGSQIGKSISPCGSGLRDVFGLLGDAASLVGIATSASQGDFLCNAGSFAADKAFLSSNFDAGREVIVRNVIPLDHSWNDDYGSGYTRGSIEVTKVFQPDPSLFHSDAYPGGTHREYKVGSWTTVETWGVRDLHQFAKQWNLPSIGVTPMPRFETIRPSTYIYTSPQTYTYTPPPVYTPSTWQNR